MTPNERDKAAALVLLSRKLAEEYHRGRHEAINDRRVHVFDQRVSETWHTFIPRTQHVVELGAAATTDASGALLWLGEALCSEYYLGWHEGVGDRRDDVYKQKIKDNWHRWVPKAKAALTEAFPHLAAIVN
jgi:hypothetical protein